jgi:hypothetical protein
MSRILTSARERDLRTGRPLQGRREAIEALTPRELEEELTVAALARGRLRMDRFATLLCEKARRAHSA